MASLALTFAVLAALLHVFIFYIESFAWQTRGTKLFGMSTAEAANTKEMAYNQGFYNLFLGIIAIAGVFAWSSSQAVGTALILAGAGSMVAAAAVLALSSPEKRGAAAKQGLLPLLALLFIIFA
ncbi:MAG: DUF1304 domain-containing protein [Corynebacterium sp.]|nr:DUF1304 domain-containing protein [Corynebacterium sp.]